MTQRRPPPREPKTRGGPAPWDQGGPPKGAPQGRPPRPPARQGPETRTPTERTSRLGAGPKTVLLWGFHPVLEALRSPRRIPLRLLATEAAAERLRPDLEARDLRPDIMGTEEIGRMAPRDAVHQGVLLQARPLEALDLSDVPDSGTVLVLDQVTDPHNVGAILRTAAAFGVTALVTTERHAPDLTGVLAKSASGGLEHVPVVHVTNLARALDGLARRGFQVIGLDSDGTVTLDAVAPEPARALVLGAEGKGLRRLTRERCQVVARLDMPGPIRSLNVSNACAVALATLRLRGAEPA